MPTMEPRSADTITIDEIANITLARYPGTVLSKNWGERAIFYNPEAILPKGIYFLTFKERDGRNDAASRIPPGGFRLNLGIDRDSFIARFGAVPARPPAAGIVSTGHDFTQTNRVMPHPVYGWMCWIAVVNPSRKTFESLLREVDHAYDRVLQKYRRRVR